MKFKLINGKIYDPSQKINGEIKNIYIDGDRIVNPTKKEKEKYNTTYDLKNMIVMAGGVDIHSHIAGGNVNNARVLMPEVHKKFTESQLNNRDHLPGKGTRWSTNGTGYRYAEMGFTTVVEPAVLPINSFSVHLELENIPLIDKAGLAVMGNDTFLLDCLNKKKDQDYINNYIAWTLINSKCLGIKVINAGGSESFKRGSREFSLDDTVPSYGVTSRKILNTISKANEQLKIPHPLHVHCNNLGLPGNVKTALDTIDAAEGRKIHLAHVQFYGYDDEGKKGFSSGAVKLTESINKNKNITVDVGQVMFKPTVTISSDILRQFEARKHAFPKKYIISEAEDGGGGIVPYEYKMKNFVNSLQWIIGLELFLLIDDPWRVYLTTDHPNGAPFTSYPKLFRLLMDYNYRMEELTKINKLALDFSFLKQIKRTYNLYEIAIMTRSAPAKLLGLKGYGSLKAGSKADITVYDSNLPIDKMFSSAKFVFKDGENIVKDGRVIKYKESRTHCLKFDYDVSIKKDIQKWFNKNYAFDIDNLSVDTEFFRSNNFKFLNIN